MPQYSSQEVENRAKGLVNLLQEKIAEVGVKSELSTNWYFYTLKVKDPEPYHAASILESLDKGCLVICFETIRLGTDGEILYHEVNIEENAGPFEALFKEAKLQNDCVKRKVERQAEVAQEHQMAMDALARMQAAYPEYNIYLTSKKPVHFGLHLEGLLEPGLEAVLKCFEGEETS